MAPGVSASPGAVEDSTLQDVEREHILKVLKRTNWRLGGENGAARILGLKRTTLQPEDSGGLKRTTLQGRMQKLQIRRDT